MKASAVKSNTDASEWQSTRPTILNQFSSKIAPLKLSNGCSLIRFDPNFLALYTSALDHRAGCWISHIRIEIHKITAISKMHMEVQYICCEALCACLCVHVLTVMLLLLLYIPQDHGRDAKGWSQHPHTDIHHLRTWSHEGESIRWTGYTVRSVISLMSTYLHCLQTVSGQLGRDQVWVDMIQIVLLVWRPIHLLTASLSSLLVSCKFWPQILSGKQYVQWRC